MTHEPCRKRGHLIVWTAEEPARRRAWPWGPSLGPSARSSPRTAGTRPPTTPSRREARQGGRPRARPRRGHARRPGEEEAGGAPGRPRRCAGRAPGGQGARRGAGGRLPKKSGGPLREGVPVGERHSLAAAGRAGFPVSMMAGPPGVSRSGLHAWLSRGAAGDPWGAPRAEALRLRGSSEGRWGAPTAPSGPEGPFAGAALAA